MIETTTGVYRANLVTVIQCGVGYLAFDADGGSYFGVADIVPVCEESGQPLRGFTTVFRVTDIRWTRLEGTIPMPVICSSTEPL